MKDVYLSLFTTRNLNHFNKFIKQQSISLFLMITYPWLRTRRRTLRWHSPPGTGASSPLSWVWRARCSISAGAPSSFWKLKSQDRWSSQKTFNFQVSLPHQLDSPPTHYKLNLLTVMLMFYWNKGNRNLHKNSPLLQMSCQVEDITSDVFNEMKNFQSVT